jgi:ADP-dependent NAD(P)H-hydrate dehydratase / NAD(P)H-hydrate epimerase
MQTLPDQLYSTEASRQLDQIAIQQYKIPAYTLMTRAAEAVFKHLQDTYPLCRRLLVCCGAGNNGGDGYVVARLAQHAGMDVDVVSLVEPEKLSGDALLAYQDWKSLGHQRVPFTPECLSSAYVVIDALLGTGLQRDVEGEWLELITALNQSSVPVISVDIPSGLDANTGSVRGVAVKAASTVSFIALKKGMFTHQAADCCGEIIFDDLGVDEKIYQQLDADARLLNASLLSENLKPRQGSSHKGNHGHVLVVGGDYGMAGAVRLAAESALRAGAGLVSVVTRPEHVTALMAGCPELMVLGLAEKESIPERLLTKVSCIVIGPGLGQENWGNQLLGQVLQRPTPKVVDADALNLLSPHDAIRDDWVLTPHPGEAAHLLNSVTPDIQTNRFTSASLLQQTYGGVAILKGSGSLVKTDARLSVCPYGNPGMATAGMGDVLTGVVAAFIAQGMSLSNAAETAVVVHGKAGDLAAGESPRGLKASDLFRYIRQLVNPE